MRDSLINLLVDDEKYTLKGAIRKLYEKNKTARQAEKMLAIS